VDKCLRIYISLTLILVSNSSKLRAIFEWLYKAYGPQHWWPGDTPFEVMVGAILTQNTAWSNVGKAMASLKAIDCLSPEAILALSHESLAGLLRPIGYFNVKARRLQGFCGWYLAQGGYKTLAREETAALRRRLLGLNGLGPETADDILLYAFRRPVFVIDTYTRRLFARIGVIQGGEGYEELRYMFESALGPDVALYNEFHALIVRHAKEVCKSRPACSGCGLAACCLASVYLSSATSQRARH
jgi:endonuclease-3 related protein